MTDDLRTLAAQLLASSPYTMTLDEANALIKERRARLLARPAPTVSTLSDPDFTAPAALVQTLLEEPKTFAAEFWRKRGTSDKPPKPEKPKTTPGRPPVGDLDERHGKFLVVDGDLDGGGDKPK